MSDDHDDNDIERKLDRIDKRVRHVETQNDLILAVVQQGTDAQIKQLTAQLRDSAAALHKALAEGERK